MESYDLSGILVEDKFEIFTHALKRAMSRDRYEHLERRAINASLREGDKVFELGAGCGVIGVAAAKIVGAENVTSVEANPELMPTIDHIHAINDVTGIKVINALVGAEKGKQTFYLSKDFWASSLDPETPKAEREIELEVLDANSVIAQSGANVLIADIEGAEFDLFEQIDFAAIDLIVIELHPTEHNFDKVARFFDTMGKAGLYPDILNGLRPTVQIFKRLSRDA
ncbi:FkbM family methyltransferase [Alphaproteobacteria bacterium KMM 3653]|uniref:FkbM family methyltransferase n=1 Tax=Harenicola maris TaxID=2841044 RepID=A0AAP2CK93_9RHOB|nr:FkbM family methyltransferase [Harenicola maris]